MRLGSLLFLVVELNQKFFVYGGIINIGGPPEDKNVTIATQFFKQNNVVTASIKLQPTRGTTGIPVHFCIVLDVSGSMGYAVNTKNAAGRLVYYNFSRLDLGRHALKAIIETMSKNDWLSIVTFSHDAKVVLEPTPMTDSGKASALQKLTALKDDLSTNLWAGLKCGWDTVRKFHSVNPKFVGLSSILLFTDGTPNPLAQTPTEHFTAYKKILKDYKESHGMSCAVNTFGFGYELESNLLNYIAEVSGGAYAYIPDCNYMGTVFTHLVANLYTVMSKDVELKIKTTEKFKIIGGHQVDYTTGGAIVRVQYLRYDQSKDFVLEFESSAESKIKIAVFLEYTLTENMMKVEKYQEAISDVYAPFQDDLEFHTIRCHFIDAVKSVLDHIASAETEIMKEVRKYYDDDEYTEGDAYYAQALGVELDKLPKISNKFIEYDLKKPNYLKTQELLLDITGQATLAFQSSRNFSSWGRHWLPSNTSGHREQIRNNFKDPGVQGYGGKLFEAIEKDGYKVFDSKVIASTLAIQNYQCENDDSASDDPPLMEAKTFKAKKDGCFHEDALVSVVEMGVDVYKKARNITRGDQVRTLGNNVATVVCVLEMNIEDEKVDMVQLPGGLMLTPYHPIYDTGSNKWVFPIDLCPPATVDCKAIYSFVLDIEHSVIINGIPCVTLGHGGQDVVRKHAYFGTHLVLDDLKRNSGWILGKINFRGTIRDRDTRLVCGFDLIEHADNKKSTIEYENENCRFEEILIENSKSMLQRALIEYWLPGVHNAAQSVAKTIKILRFHSYDLAMQSPANHANLVTEF